METQTNTPASAVAAYNSYMSREWTEINCLTLFPEKGAFLWEMWRGCCEQARKNSKQHPFISAAAIFFEQLLPAEQTMLAAEACRWQNARNRKIFDAMLNNNTTKNSDYENR